MKKYLIISIILLIFMSFMLIGCEEQTSGTSTGLSSLRIDENSPKNFDATQDVDLSRIRIIATYKDGTEEEIRLNDAMLSDEDRQKFTTVAASHTIRIEYKGKAVLYNFSVSESIPEQEYYAYFESNGGSAVNSQYTKVISAFTIPVRAGYTFIGWFNNVDFAGSKAEAPYPLFGDTTFYAQWQDNRRWSVIYLDYQGNPIEEYTHTIVHGTDVEHLPLPPEVEGYIFQRWQGPIEHVTEDIIVESIYERIYFNIEVFQDDTMKTRISTSPPIPYGETYPVTSLPDEVPYREGYTGRWKIFTEYGLEDITDQFDSIKKDYIVVPDYEIIKFSIIFYDDSAFAGTGTSWPNIITQVNYGSQYDLEQSGNPNITAPRPREGHIGQWAVLIDGQWINIKDGSLWDEDEKVWIESPDPISSIDLVDTENNVIATISNGYLISDIKGNINIQAKYEREQYNLFFNRVYQGLTTELYQVLNINYGTKFSLYKPEEGDPVDPDIVYGEKTRKEIVNYQSPNDWDIEWYPSNNFEPSEIIDFEDGAYITVGPRDGGSLSGNTMSFYCYDIDLRIHEVEFYDWDFENEEPVLLSVPIEIDGQMQNVQTQEVAHGEHPVIPTLTSKVEYGYDLVGIWFDAPQGKTYANQINSTEILKDTKFYARYTIRTYTVIFRDYNYPYDDKGNADDLSVIESLPPVDYNHDQYGDPLSYGHLYMESIYQRQHGYEFGDNEVYFGGDEIWEKIQFIMNFLADEQLYNDYLTQEEQINLDFNNYNSLVNDYEDYEEAVIYYQTDDERWDGYEQPDYQTYMNYRELAEEAWQKINFMEQYAGYRQNYYMELRYEKETDEFGNYLTDGEGNYIYKTDGSGEYIDNGDYQRMLNLFYEREGREGYEFDGWFTSPNFDANTRVSQNIGDDIITNFTVDNNIVLYAKWVDLEKGSDGLVFERVQEPNPDYVEGGDLPELLTYYIVIDYLDIEDEGNYEEIIIEGELYYRFTDPLTKQERTLHENLISFNDKPEVQETELRIPAFHQGLPVKRIREGAIGDDRGMSITKVSIPNNLEIIDEGVFASCMVLKSFILSEENDYFVLKDRVLFSADGLTLICYPPAPPEPEEIEAYEYMIGEIKVPYTTYVVPADVTRIAKGAFSFSQLRHIVFDFDEEFTDPLEIGEEAFRGCSELRAVGHFKTFERELDGEGTETIYIADNYLPDRLVSIGARAFQGCLYILYVNAYTNSQLIYVGEDAFSDTYWYNNILETDFSNGDQTYYVDGSESDGIITVGYVVIGTVIQYNNTILTLDDTLTRAVADKAFYNKSNLKRIIIENTNFQRIGNDAFRNMSSLDRVDIKVTDPTQIDLGLDAFRGSGNLSIYVPQGSLDDYVNAEGWNQYADMYEELE